MTICNRCNNTLIIKRSDGVKFVIRNMKALIYRLEDVKIVCKCDMEIFVEKKYLNLVNKALDNN